MDTYSPVNNCYRAILSLINHLDSLCENKLVIKEIYEELSELAYYIMEDDCERMVRGIEQMKRTFSDLKCTSSQEDERFQFISTEINTHLDFLLIEYCNHPAD